MAEANAIKVQEQLKQLRSLVREIDKKMGQNEITLKQITETHDSCYKEGKISVQNEVSVPLIMSI